MMNNKTIAMKELGYGMERRRRRKIFLLFGAVQVGRI